MRTWRKVYATILDSEQVSQLSDGAAFLLTLLVVAQDDTGYWPWTPAKVRRLTNSRPNWTATDTETYARELVAAGLAKWADGGIVLVKGSALNGTPRTDSKPEIIPRITKDTPCNELATPCIESATARNEPDLGPFQKLESSALEPTDIKRVKRVDSSVNATDQAGFSVCNELATPCIEVVPLEQSRVDKSRVDLEKNPDFVASQNQPPELPDELPYPPLENPEKNPYDFEAYVARALEYGPEYPNKKEACAHAKAAITAKIKPQELVKVAEYLLETDVFWEGKPLQIATLVKNSVAYRKAIVNGWKPGQKGHANNGRSTAPKNISRDLPTSNEWAAEKRRLGQT